VEDGGAQQRAVLALHRQRVCGSDHDAERQQGAEDARQGEHRQQEVGALDLGVAVEPRVGQRRDAHEQVEALVLGAPETSRCGTLCP